MDKIAPYIQSNTPSVKQYLSSRNQTTVRIQRTEVVAPPCALESVCPLGIGPAVTPDDLRSPSGRQAFQTRRDLSGATEVMTGR